MLLDLRPLTSTDFSATMRIFSAVFPSKYTAEFLDAWKLRESSLSFGAFTLADRLVGFVVVCSKGPAHYRLEFLGVDPTLQKGGVGTRLLRSVLDACSTSRVTLIPVNDERIIQWYKHHGFRDSGPPVPSPYTGEPEQVMERPPSPAVEPQAGSPCLRAPTWVSL